jgi:hypothetical protein
LLYVAKQPALLDVGKQPALLDAAKQPALLDVAKQPALLDAAKQPAIQTEMHHSFIHYTGSYMFRQWSAIIRELLGFV